VEKKRRQQMILALIHERPVQNQQALACLLAEKGFSATQATLSRDLHDLNLVKTSQGYRLPEDLKQGPNGAAAMKDSLNHMLVEASAANNLVVVKTRPGNASPLAVNLDSLGWQEIVGTIAGDDTVLVITRNARKAKDLQKKLLQLANL
jgi:transcriptional regulator of arginine metabolism